MQVIVVYFCNVWIRDYYEGEVAQSLDPVCEADGEEGECEIRRGEEGFGGERWAAMSGEVTVISAKWHGTR